MIFCCKRVRDIGTARAICRAYWRPAALYQRALEMDPAYAAARAGLALTYIAEVIATAGRPGHQS